VDHEHGSDPRQIDKQLQHDGRCFLGGSHLQVASSQLYWQGDAQHEEPVDNGRNKSGAAISQDITVGAFDGFGEIALNVGSLKWVL
jgi:hypothetical protein